MRPQRTRPESADLETVELFILEESTVVATILVSSQGNILGANARMRKFLGVASPDVLIGRPLTEFLVDSEDWSFWLQALTLGCSAALTTRLRGPNGIAIALRGDVRTAPHQTKSGDVLCGVFVDTNEEEQLRAAVQRSARLEALGGLTAGIAHDFNNLLTVLVGNLSLVAEDVRADPKLFEKLKSARDAGKRGSDLIRQLLTFARREEIQADLIDPGKVIADLLPLLRRALGARIKIETELEPVAGIVKASTAQLESVVVNLAINARDAIEKKGTVLIQVAAVELSSADAAQRGLAMPGRYVAISVTDDGSGIPVEVLGRIFEPFFSTKTDRGGTGLGLSMVRWFAERSGGSAYVDSVLAKGTTVTLLLPDVPDGVPDGVPEASDKTMPLSILPTGTETVLVFAAEEGLRSTIRQILEVLGYSTKFTADSEEMLALLRDEDVQVLIFDCGLRNDPSQTELLSQARTIAPQLKLVMTTDTPTFGERSVTNGAAVLLKPFSIADLANTVRQTLDSEQRPKAN
ncbi:MAG TPA: ATP-binding protein [Gammaproteobacteria bacterium]|nr:ATP-binding protein [Gammaproteobacteria bacterium]